MNLHKKNTLGGMCLETPHSSPSLFFLVYPIAYIGSSRSTILARGSLFPIVLDQNLISEAAIFTTHHVPPSPVLYQIVLGAKDEQMSVLSRLVLYVNDKSFEKTQAACF